MSLFLLGTHFKTAPVEVREKLHFAKEILPKAYASALKHGFVPVILSTCNRVEIYVFMDVYSVKEVSEKIQNWLEDFHNISMPKEVNFYRISQTRAHAHLCSVASGLGSLVVGENQVLGQVREAYKAASRHAKLPAPLSRAFEMAIACGKKVRTATNIGKGAMSLGSITLDLIREMYGEREALNVCVIGAGEIAEEVLSKLVRRDNTNVVVVNRTKEKAENAIKKFSNESANLSFSPWNEMYSCVSRAQLVITSISGGRVLYKKQYEAVRSKIRFVFFLDLGVPRNVDVSIEQLQDVALYSIDDLQRIVAENAALRNLEVSKAKEVVDEKVEEWNEWLIKQSIFEKMKESVQRLHGKDIAAEKMAEYLKKMESGVIKCPLLEKRAKEQKGK